MFQVSCEIFEADAVVGRIENHPTSLRSNSRGASVIAPQWSSLGRIHKLSDGWVAAIRPRVTNRNFAIDLTVDQQNRDSRCRHNFCR